MPFPARPPTARRPRVLNLSLGGQGSCSSTMQAAIDAARAKGALVVVAAGNDEVDAAGFQPANCKGVMTVGASNFSGGQSSYSNFGETLALSAPGGDDDKGVPSLFNNGATSPTTDTYGSKQGTSMATPHVAGTAALMLAANSLLSADVAHYLMIKTAKPFAVACSTCGSGILSAEQAVLAARGWRPEREPNDSVAQAHYVNVFPGRVWGAIEPTNTQVLDHYSVYLPPNAQLGARLSMLDMPGFEMKTSIDLVDATGKVLQAGYQVAGQPEINYQNIKTQGVTLYVRVKGTPIFGIGTTKSYRYELRLYRQQY